MKISKIELEFLKESNLIEREARPLALHDACKAWDYVRNLGELTIMDVLLVHTNLMERIRPDIAGQWRRCDVMIGGKVKRFYNVQVFEQELRDVLGVMSSKPEKGKRAEMARHCHIMFEHIHPFEDGNGRVGRILYNWHRLRLGLPIHVIHEGAEQMEYYQWFK